MKYCISLASLWDFLRGERTHAGDEICVTTESKDWDGNWPAPSEGLPDSVYFDLKKNGYILCMDGEECECVYEPEKDAYTCVNPESEASFLLTAEEFASCTFS